MAYATYTGTVFQYEIEACVIDEDGHVDRPDPHEAADFWGVYRRPIAPDADGAHLAMHIEDHDDLQLARQRAAHFANLEHRRSA